MFPFERPPSSIHSSFLRRAFRLWRIPFRFKRTREIYSKFSLFKVRMKGVTFFFFPSWFLEAGTHGENTFSVYKGEEKWVVGETHKALWGGLSGSSRSLQRESSEYCENAGLALSYDEILLKWHIPSLLLINPAGVALKKAEPCHGSCCGVHMKIEKQ